MAYSAEISRNNPAGFILLLDQSGSMADPFGTGTDAMRKADYLANVVNRTLQNLVLRCAKAEEIRDYFHLAVVGYGPGVPTSAFSGSLANQGFVPISRVADEPVRVEDRVKKVPDGAGGLLDQNVRFPIWVEPQANGQTPMCAALDHTRSLVELWLSTHQTSFPPVILHITDGDSTDGDPRAKAADILGLASLDGPVLLFNCHISAGGAAPIEYPKLIDAVPSGQAQVLFECSSVLPPEFRRAASEGGRDLDEGARGFVFNADAVSLVQFFDIGTRPANLR